jgi:Arc/MetJ-type ribon-helix-helix transcriptional regulator
MVKSTVRFPESVIGEIESLVEAGYFESKSEFHRFASEYVLTEVAEDYDPEMIDFESVRADLMPVRTFVETAGRPRDDGSFLQSAVMVRRYVFRGKFRDAEDFIDHHYAPDERDCLLLEELLELYRRSLRGRPAESERSPDRDRPPEEPSR